MTLFAIQVLHFDDVGKLNWEGKLASPIVKSKHGPVLAADKQMTATYASQDDAHAAIKYLYKMWSENDCAKGIYLDVYEMDDE